MNYFQAIGILNRVRNGDKTPSQAEITQALELTGDLSRLDLAPARAFPGTTP